MKNKPQIIYSDANAPISINADTLVKSQLSGMNLHRAILTGLDISSSVLIRTELRGAEMQYANISYCDLSGSCLTGASCIGTDFSNANLSNCLANNASFINSDFTNADLNSVNMSGCDLQGSIMLAKNIETVNFSNAVYDDTTIWPNNFDPISYGAIKKNLETLLYTKDEYIDFINKHIEELIVFYDKLKNDVFILTNEILQCESTQEKALLIRTFKSLALCRISDESIFHSNKSVIEIVDIALGY